MTFRRRECSYSSFSRSNSASSDSNGLKAADARRPDLEVERVEQSVQLGERMLCLVRVQHLVAEPRVQEVTVGDPRVELLVEREPLLEFLSRQRPLRVPSSIVLEQFEERSTAVSVVEPEVERSTGCDGTYYVL